MVAFFNQLSGINFIFYYAPEILAKAGLAEKDSLLNSIAIGGTNLIFTFVGLYLIDRLGRKIIDHWFIGIYHQSFNGGLGFLCSCKSWLIVNLSITVYRSPCCWAGCRIWVFISEIFPNKVRATGNHLAPVCIGYLQQSLH